MIDWTKPVNEGDLICLRINNRLRHYRALRAVKSLRSLRLVDMRPDARADIAARAMADVDAMLARVVAASKGGAA